MVLHGGVLKGMGEKEVEMIKAAAVGAIESLLVESPGEEVTHAEVAVFGRASRPRYICMEVLSQSPCENVFDVALIELRWSSRSPVIRAGGTAGQETWISSAPEEGPLSPVY